MAGMVMKMRPLAGLDIPAGQPVTLKPGGEHIMLLDLNGPLREGQSFPLTLTFEKAGTREVSVAIEKPGAAGPATQR
jgi:periplasmic copper chaperone A